MNINLTKCKTSAQAVTKICYNEKTRNLNFQVECEDLEDLKECINIIKAYNDFDARIVNKALENIASVDKLRFKIGREGSPVLYVRCFRFVENFEEEMDTFAEIVKADEHWVVEDTPLSKEYRLWWD